MRILIILGHPDPKSFNYAIASGVPNALQSDGAKDTALKVDKPLPEEKKEHT